MSKYVKPEEHDTSKMIELRDEDILNLEAMFNYARDHFPEHMPTPDATLGLGMFTVLMIMKKWSNLPTNTKEVNK